MNSTLRSVLIFLSALFVGVLVVAGIEYIGGLVFPPPAGLDHNNIESIKEHMSEISIGSFALLLIAHLAGAFVSGFILGYFGTNVGYKVLILGLLWTLIGVANLVFLPHPIWFTIADSCVYLPFTLLGSKLAFLQKSNK